ncbi:3'-5' exonuclease [Hymenobacter metallicola]|uniref:3'-5' exonuclease n=1 Tax=Hymenobacter metallicola TaxID=2563114 RepID=A0A4Z0PYB1_9BACT|nr:3'-5' exonuclease [Hymenobacter metallicola]TGE22707.1 3'-5' exonuclease [Hymenobacter metallicola]
MLRLVRPLVVFDLETTGTDTVNDRIVEISILKIFPDGTRETKTRRLHPGRPIPAGATAVHGISDADVAAEPTFKQIAKGLLAYLSGCDLCTFNGKRFDVPLLAEEFALVGLDFPSWDTSVIDVSDIYRILNPRTLAAAVTQYLGRDHTQAHTAEADTAATFELLEALAHGPLAQFLQTNDQVCADELFCPSGLSDFGDGVHHGHSRAIRIDPAAKMIRNPEGIIVWNFGKHFGQPVTQSDPGYINWIMGKDFAQTTKLTVRKVMDRLLV